MSLQNNTGKTSVSFCLQTAHNIGWLLLVVLTPLMVNIWGQQPFELPKVIWIRTLIWFLAGGVLLRLLLRGHSKWFQTHVQGVLLPVVVLALVIVVTTATAVNGRLSLWGSYERQQGAITLLTYLLVFLLATSYFQAPENRKRVVAAMAGTGFPLILLSIAQYLGWQPFGLLTDARSPIYATLGRANFLAAYLAILIPLTLFLLLTAQNRLGQLLWGMLLLGDLAIMGLTLARSAWLATAVSLSIFALLWWGKQLPTRTKTLAWIGTGSLIVSGPLMVWIWGTQQAGSIAARRTIWQASIALIKERPLLGYGADALGLVFPGVYPPELVYYQGREYFVDRAHNLFLDWAITAGLPGVMAFSLILLVCAFLWWRAWQQPQPPARRALLAAVIAAVTGAITNNLTSFDITPTAIAFWLLLGMNVALSQPVNTSAHGIVVRKRPFTQWLLTICIGTMIGVAVWQANIRPLLADIAARSAVQLAQNGQGEQAILAAKNAVKQWPIEPAYHLYLYQAYWQQAVAAQQNPSTWLAEAEAALLTTHKLRANDPALWLQTAQFYQRTGQQFNHDTDHLVDTAYQQAVTFAPNHATLYTAWGDFHLQGGDIQQAAVLLRQAIKLDASNGDTYLRLAAAEVSQGNLNAALNAYHEAVRLLPDSSQAYSGLAYCYWQLGDAYNARQAVAAALQRNPRNQQALMIHEALETR